ncbi:39S ribosomal protein L20, mitochondrial [Chionoecetes opilio]|uniref:39S ribosomal protein L20, mitochondrial n=1 Tax=Chionoecetes opilio TaxID=41210 RepID=A0A8J5BVS3_CHIOP|nr:39S ribosomal protein L20, mitochondrial [Chionoecetes opilio]
MLMGYEAGFGSFLYPSSSPTFFVLLLILCSYSCTLQPFSCRENYSPHGHLFHTPTHIYFSSSPLFRHSFWSCKVSPPGSPVETMAMIEEYLAQPLDMTPLPFSQTASSSPPTLNSLDIHSQPSKSQLRYILFHPIFHLPLFLLLPPNLPPHFFGRKKNCYTVAIKYVNRALRYNTLSKKLKKRDDINLWDTRISAACTDLGTRYSDMKVVMDDSNIHLNRVILQNLAIWEPRSFRALALLTKAKQEVGLNSLEGPSPAGVVTRGML